MEHRSVVGQSILRVDGPEKVAREAIYGYDLVLPNMLYGKVVFSTRPHAQITRIRTDKARQCPGVVAVITGQDAPWTPWRVDQRSAFFSPGNRAFRR